MANSCEHLTGLTPESFPPQKTPDACEECLPKELFGSLFASADRAATLAAAIHRPASMQTDTSLRPNIRSCALSRPRLGSGAMCMKPRVCSLERRRRAPAGDAGDRESQCATLNCQS